MDVARMEKGDRRKETFDNSTPITGSREVFETLGAAWVTMKT